MTNLNEDGEMEKSDRQIAQDPGLVEGHLSHVVVIESLEEGEVRTGKNLAEYLSTLDHVEQHSIQIEYRTCDSSTDFIEHLIDLCSASVNAGMRPIVHIECHGHPTDGLEFANGSEMSWLQLAEQLRPLNLATGFNLVVVVSACYGGHFVSELYNGQSSPCLLLLGPTEAVMPHEIIAGFITFYRSFFQSLNVGVAARALWSRPPESGGWLLQHAELWYRQVATGYIEKYCTSAAIKKRTAAIAGSLRAAGIKASMTTIKREMIQANRERLTGVMFDRHFMLESLPQNRARFEPARQRLQARLNALRATGRYSL